MLLLQDARLASVATLVAGEVVRGSWWGHAAGKAIFAASSALDDDPDVVTAKLVDGKVTFVHRRLFPPLVAVGRAREGWQLGGLERGAERLLERIDEEGRVRAAGPDATSLQLRLLVAARQVHTEAGAHATELTTWAVFARERAVRTSLTPAAARAKLEAAAADLGENPRLPWRAGERRRR